MTRRKDRHPVRVVAIGDVHGHWDKAARLAEQHAQAHGTPDLIVQVGDGEPNRDEQDAAGVHGPAKYRKLGNFPQVVSGDITFPAPLVFIGGNHDPWPALDEHGPGEWAPGVTFLGRSGRTEVAGLTIVFLSGIWSDRTSPRRPQDRRSPRERSYYAEAELAKARNSGRCDLLVTHDWPDDVGDTGRDGRYGDPNVTDLARAVCPALHVAGHMHRRLSSTARGTTFEAMNHIREPTAAATFEIVAGTGTATLVG